MMKFLAVVFITAAVLLIAEARPQAQEKYVPMPYNFDWKVEDAKSSNYYGQKEAGNDYGRVDGNYYVWLPDGRLMSITYYVDGDSGFVPQISYTAKANPLG
ncbi:pro-resilin isoform X2 [Anabrus simplex]